MIKDAKPKEKEVTKVTTVAQEEQAAGQKIEMPSPEDLVSRASGSLLSKLKQLELVLPKLSSKSTKRALIAGLNLPQDGVPVQLRTPEEKMAFALIQRIIGDRFIITQHHINLQIQEQRALEASLAKAEKEKAEKDGEKEKENE